MKTTLTSRDGHKPIIKSCYLDTVFHKEILTKFLKAARVLVKKYDFQSFAFRGMSGALVAPLLAYQTNKTMLMVRKPKVEDSTESSDHSEYRVEGDLAARRYIIVDDFICSGATMRATIEEISKAAPNAKCLGILLYKNYILYGEKLKIYPCGAYGSDAFVIQDPERFRKV